MWTVMAKVRSRLPFATSSISSCYPASKGSIAKSSIGLRPASLEAYPHLQAILTRPIRWDLIRQHYETMIQYATALRLVERPMPKPSQTFYSQPLPTPTYHAVIELGKVIKTIFLCQYLQEEALRRN